MAWCKTQKKKWLTRWLTVEPSSIENMLTICKTQVLLPRRSKKTFIFQVTMVTFSKFLGSVGRKKQFFHERKFMLQKIQRKTYFAPKIRKTFWVTGFCHESVVLPYLFYFFASPYALKRVRLEKNWIVSTHWSWITESLSWASSIMSECYEAFPYVAMCSRM